LPPRAGYRKCDVRGRLFPPLCEDHSAFFSILLKLIFVSRLPWTLVRSDQYFPYLPFPPLIRAGGSVLPRATFADVTTVGSRGSRVFLSSGDRTGLFASGRKPFFFPLFFPVLPFFSFATQGHPVPGCAPFRRPPPGPVAALFTFSQCIPSSWHGGTWTLTGPQSLCRTFFSPRFQFAPRGFLFLPPFSKLHSNVDPFSQ